MIEHPMAEMAQDLVYMEKTEQPWRGPVGAVENFPLPPTARHDEHGNHIPPHIPEWYRAADPGSPHYDPDRAVCGSEVERDQRQKAAFAAHVQEHRRRGEPAEVVEWSEASTGGEVA